MKNLLVFTLVVLFSFIAFSSQNGKKVAIVKVLRGKAEVLSPSGDKAKLKKGMWLNEGSIIKTSPRSFVRLSFIDKSSMNIGPKSELKIEKFSKTEAGVINVLTGKIRSQVTKDYLKMDKDKSKLFVKSRNAVMGVRGTDFVFSTNKRTGATTTVLFEGSIVFNKFKKGDNLQDLESIVNKGRRIKPGEVSVAMRGRKKPTVPAKMSSSQFKKLNENKTFKVSDIKNVKKLKSVVPPGLSGAVVAGDNNNLKDEIKKIVKVNVNAKTNNNESTSKLTEDSKGFAKGDDIKPADGVMIHVDTGTIIPPGVDSKFDQNTGEWVSSTNGGTSASGEYIPPQGFQINDDGQLLKVDVDSGIVEGQVKIVIGSVDDVPPIVSAPIVKPAIIEGPKPANDPNVDNGEPNPDDDPFGPVLIDEPVDQPIGDPALLPPPPKPSGCSTCNQPDTFFNDSGNLRPPPPPPGKARVKIKVNKSN